jgi:hypothetical protein
MGKRMIILGLAAMMLSIEGAVFAQTMVTLDQAISYSANEIETRLEAGVRVMVLNFKSPSQRLSNYVLDEMTNMLTKSGSLTSVEKANLEFLLRELRYERSGDIGDEAAQSIGRILGAQYVVSGLIEDFTTNYIIQFKTMPVEPSALQTLTRVSMLKDAQITNLMGSDTFTQTGAGTSPQTRTGGSGQAKTDTTGMAGVGTSNLNNKFVLSAGGGAFGKIQFMHLSLGGISTSADPSMFFGPSLFLDAELFRYLLLDLSANYLFGDYYGISGNGFNAAFTLFGQYPIQLADRFTLSPLLGIGYDMFFYARLDSTNVTRKDLSDMDILYAKSGVSLNYNLTGNVRLNARFVYDFMLYNKAIAEQTKGTGASAILHAPSLFLGVDYVFLRI